MIRHIATGMFLLAAADMDAVDPHTLTIQWPGGEIEQVAATNRIMCDRASLALITGKWMPVGHDEPPESVTCVPGSIFADDAFCIHGLNCPVRR